MDYFKIPDGMDKVEAKKKVSNFNKAVINEAKPTNCLICGKPQTSFCNSHSVPQFVLKNIAENGKLLQANSLLQVEVLELEKGVNNSGTFHFICNSCDSTLFQLYENAENLVGNITDKLLAEIAMKDLILMLSKRSNEKVLYSKLKDTGRFHGHNVMLNAQELDERDYLDELALYRTINESDTGNFKMIYKVELPYRVPIATQTPLVLPNDLEGNVINDIFDFSENVRMQNIHISVFPLESTTIVLLFYHRRDKNYRSLMHQFNCLSEEVKLQYINYWIFKYTENYYFSPKIKNVLETNGRLQDLSRENYDLPALGHITGEESFLYKPVKMEEIPNLLSAKYSI